MSEQRIALVTGGTGGIGNAICRRLGDAGCKVATTYRNQEKAEQWKRECADDGYDFLIYHCDVGGFEECEETARRVEKDLGMVDIVVNNAGLTQDGLFKKMSSEQWLKVIDADLNSIFNVTRQFVNGMVDRGFGRVINISSINGQKGQFGQTNYAAAKAGMHGFTMSLAQEVARYGVTVNTISPGYIGTEMVMAVPEAVREKIIAQIPVGRLGKPEEVAELVAYIVSPQAAFMTGANLAINGGQHME